MSRAEDGKLGRAAKTVLSAMVHMAERGRWGQVGNVLPILTEINSRDEESGSRGDG